MKKKIDLNKLVKIADKIIDHTDTQNKRFYLNDLSSYGTGIKPRFAKLLKNSWAYYDANYETWTCDPVIRRQWPQIKKNILTALA